MKKYVSYIIPISLIIIVLCGFFVYRYYQNKSEPINWLKYTNDQFKLNLSYPETFKPTAISENDKVAKVIFRAEEAEPSALVSLRYEERVGILKVAQKGTVLEVLAENFNNQYPKRFTDFKKENEETITVDGAEAKQFYFTYLGADNKTRMKQRFIIVTHDYDSEDLGTVAFYLSFQSPESDFEKVNSDFEKILQSLKFL